MKKTKLTRETLIEIVFLFSVFTLYLLWAVLIPFGKCPDEEFRYKIPDYIYQFSKLPRGDDPYIMDATWGLSYGFTPILSYIFSGIFMKITSFFTTDIDALHLAARMVSVFFSTGTAFFTLRIGKKIFKGTYKWLFIILVTLLPQFIFISAYVNCDAISMFAVAWIIYGIINGNEKTWSIKSCLFLGAGIGVCLLSYYNAYGVILMAAVFCVLSVIFNKDIDKKIKFITTRVGWVILATVIVSGWWFVRSYIIYDGDLLGLEASRKCAEQHAIESLKPHNRSTPYKVGYSLRYMLVDMEWIKYSINSFIGRFGLFTVLLPDLYYFIVRMIIGVGVFGNVIYKNVRKIYEVKQRALFSIAMIGSVILTIGISMYYSYFNDFQPQGRYCLPMWMPLAILVTAGIGGIVELLPKVLRKPVVCLICIVFFAIAMSTTFSIVLPEYY